MPLFEDNMTNTNFILAQAVGPLAGVINGTGEQGVERHTGAE